MKNIILVFLLFFSFGRLLAQSSKNEIKIMIDSAINLVYHFNKEDSIRSIEKLGFFHNIYILDEQDRPLNYLHDTLDKRFHYMDIYSKRAFEIFKKGIRAWKIVARLQGNVFSINIIDYTVTHKKNDYRFAKGASNTVIFELDCSKHEWKYKSFNYYNP